MLDKLYDEAGRLAALDRYSILDTQPEAQFDKITALVRTVLDVPMAAVSLIARDRQWLKSRQGLSVCEMPRDASFCTHTIQRREPLVVPDTTLHPLFADHSAVTGPPFIRSYLGIPLTSADGYNLGALCAIDLRPRSFRDAEIRIMSNFAALVMDEMELRLIAQSDFLTGALTRRAFMTEMDRAWSRFGRQGETAAIVLFDIDHFKKINDSRGHAAGDAVLRAIAACCAGQLRGGDAFGRLGGEEFAILLGNTDPREAALAADRVRRSVAALRVDSLPDLSVTVSLGIAPLTSEVASLDEWLARADAAMYAAKQSGRNRCCADDGRRLERS